MFKAFELTYVQTIRTATATYQDVAQAGFTTDPERAKRWVAAHRDNEATEIMLDEVDRCELIENN